MRNEETLSLSSPGLGVRDAVVDKVYKWRSPDADPPLVDEDFDHDSMESGSLLGRFTPSSESTSSPGDPSDYFRPDIAISIKFPLPKQR
jgi:hypothetical protein